MDLITQSLLSYSSTVNKWLFIEKKNYICNAPKSNMFRDATIRLKHYGYKITLDLHFNQERLKQYHEEAA